METSTQWAIGPITVDLLFDLWPKIVLDTRARDRRIATILDAADPASVSGTSIVLVTRYRFHQEKLDDDRQRELLQEVIGRLVQVPVSVRTELRGDAAKRKERQPLPASSGSRAPSALALAAMPYPEYLKTEHWRRTAAAARERAGHRCQVCNRHGELHAHHRTYIRRGSELPGDLIVLCATCHELFHTHGRLARR